MRHFTNTSGVSVRNNSIFRFIEIRFFSVLLLLLLVSGESWGQISISNNIAISENFSIGTSSTASLPSNWKISAPGTGSNTLAYTTAGNLTSVTQGASSGTPTTGGSYNWGNGTITSDRAIGFMTSGGYASPNSIFAYYRNTSGSQINDITISYDFERYRTNTATVSVALYTSINGTTWTSRLSGDIATTAFVTGTSAYNFTSGTIVSKTVQITGVNIANNGDFYVMWLVTNTNGSNSQGIGLDNVSVTATLAPTFFAVTYNTNSATSGIVPTDATSYSTGASVTVLGNTGSLTKTGYTFSGWNTAADGSGTNYNPSASFSMPAANTTLYARWKSNDATLSALSLSTGTLSPSFASGTTSYTASVDNETSAITVTPTCNQANASIEAQVNNGGYSTVTSGSASGSLPLTVGDNTVNVKVTAQDGTTIQTYTVTVNRAAVFLVANPAAFIATTASANQINLTATANGNTNNILVVSNGSGTFTTPTNGVAAGVAGTSFAGGTIIYNGAAESITNHSGLTPNTSYYYKAFSVDNSTNYSSGLTINATTAKVEPSNQASSILVPTIVTSTSIPLTWTSANAGSQTPDGYLLKLSTGTISDPVDGTDPGAGSLLINSDTATYKASTGATFSNAIPGTMYKVKIYSYTNSGNLIDYNTTAAPEFNVATTPNTVSTANITTTGPTTATISWSSAGGYDNTNHSTLVFVKPTSSITTGSPTFAPSAYTANTVFGSGTHYQADALATCVFNGDGTSVSITGLAANTSYNVLIYTVVDATNSNAKNTYSNAITASGTTSSLSAPTAISASGISTTEFRANWNTCSGAGGYKLDVSTLPNFGISTTVINEGFENETFPPTNWITSNWNRSTTFSDIATGNGATICGSYTGTLSTPAVAYPSYITFNLGRTANATAKTLTVDISTTSQSDNFTTIATFNHNNVPSESYDQHTVDLSSYSTSPTVYIRFNKSSTTTSPWRLDNIVVTNLFSNFVDGYNSKSIDSQSSSTKVSGLTPNTTYYYRIRAISTNSTSPNSNTITVLTAPAAPVATSATNATTTSFMANWNAPVGGTTDYRLDVATNNEFTSLVSGYNNLSVSGTSQSVSGLSPNTLYYYRVRATNGTTSENSETITAATTNTMLVNTSISVSTLPACTTCDVVVANSATLNLDVSSSFHSVTVNPGGRLTLADSKTLTGALILESDITGTATFVDQNTTENPIAVVATVNQYLTKDRNWYLSSPVTAADTLSLSSASSIVRWNEKEGKWASPTSSKLTPTTGYVSTATKTDGVVTFNGTLNSGNYSINLTRTTGRYKEGFNLIGNPYASYLNWTSSIASDANTLSTIWYRTKTEGGAYTFMTYNADGDIGVPINTLGIIPPMQAFWVRANTGGGMLTLNNSMRTHNDMSTNKLKSPGEKSNARQILRLEVNNATNSDETVIYFDKNASDEFDKFDSPKMGNANAVSPEIFTMSDNEKLVINGLKDVSLDREIPLGFETGESNLFSIKVTEINNFDPTIRIVLKDKLSDNKEIELTAGTTYSFNSDVTSTTSRFSVLFKVAGTTTDIKSSSDISGLHVYKNATNGITIAYNSNNKPTISIYNCIGQELTSRKLCNSITQIDGSFPSGIYFITVKNAGQFASQKIIIN